MPSGVSRMPSAQFETMRKSGHIAASNFGQTKSDDTMTLPILPVSSSNRSSVRYQRLLECIPMALDKCHGKIDVEHAIQICYGSSCSSSNSKNDSTTTTISSDNDIFCTMLRDNILQQQFHHEVINDVTAFLQKNNVQEKLYRLETIIRKVDSDIALQEKENQNDKTSTMMALQRVNLIGNVSPTDMIQYQSYHNMLKHKKVRLQQDIVQLEQSIQAMQDQIRQHQHESEQNLQNVKIVHVELEQSADLCAMIR